MPVESVSLGCRLNAYESERMRSLATRAGLESAVIVNTCAVTAEAVRQSRQAIRRARRQNPGAELVVTGCAAEIDPESFASMPEAVRLIRNAEKIKAETWGLPAGTNAAETRPRRARAYVEVQNGCDHSCTFCIIPQGRGTSRSTPMETVVDEVRRRCDEGYAEVVLTGVDLTSYGEDLEDAPSLGGLVAAILEGVPDLARLRLSSIDAAEVDPELEELLAGDPKVMPHVHLSLQAGDDMILKRMRRRHSRRDAVEFCGRLRARRDISVGADLIAGFPTETEEMFGNTLALLDDCELSYAHVFPYSARPGTPAARMPQLPRETVLARAKALREAAERRYAMRLEGRVGRTEYVLMETPTRGRTECHAPVALSTPCDSVGGVVRRRMQGVEGSVLLAS